MKRLNRNLRVFIAAIAIVFIWKGTWSILDIFIKDLDPLLANASLIVLGVIILIVDDLELKELRRGRKNAVKE
jgi:drug/metabolite transporter (DMT)-like permease